MDHEERLKALLDLTDHHICPNCLGRKFSDCVEGPGNLVRGVKIQERYQITLKRPCYICGDVFEKLTDAVKAVEKKIGKLKLDYSSILVGTTFPGDFIEFDQEINQELKIDVEGIKKEVNRELGKRLMEVLDCSVNFENPDLVIMVDFSDDIKVWIQINPLFIEGRYLKLVRNIPQTRWPCRLCRGRGCERCNYTGKMYGTSVEELISEPVLKATGGKESKFHGAGREDVDVRMLGNGRPFVVEIKEPRLRKPDLEKLEERINKKARGMVFVKELKFSSRNRKVQLKNSSRSSYKVYRAMVKLERPVNPEELDKLKSLRVINQRTPLRVSHRRADKVRTRRVLGISWKFKDDDCLELIIKSEGGLYIKELISGDSERTYPSVSSVLGVPARCLLLDVVEVGDEA